MNKSCLGAFWDVLIVFESYSEEVQVTQAGTAVRVRGLDSSGRTHTVTTEEGRRTSDAGGGCDSHTLAWGVGLET